MTWESEDNPNRDPEDPRSPWAVQCMIHGQVFLDHDEYVRQMARTNDLWVCPVCREPAEFDDDNYEDWYDSMGSS